MDERSDSPNGTMRVAEVFRVFLLLGLTSFGGPIAHIGYFRKALVEQRHWMTEQQFAQLLTLCQFLPGPASSQLGFLLGQFRAGWFGALAAFVAFTSPSVIALIAFASALTYLDTPIGVAAVHGLKLVACIIVFDAVKGMWKNLCPDWPRRAIAVGAAALLIGFHLAAFQLVIIALGAALGTLICRVPPSEGAQLKARYGRSVGGLFIALFVVCFAALAIFKEHSSTTRIAYAFFQPGALVFGGGHVVLPLLEHNVVATGWLDQDAFLAGYGASQAIPGPLFSFSAYLGAMIDTGNSAFLSAGIALICMFLPGFLLVAGALPFWQSLSQNSLAASALAGVNAAVVGILLAAFYDPVLTSGLRHWEDLAIVLFGIAAMHFKQVSPLGIVLVCVSLKIVIAVMV